MIKNGVESSTESLYYPVHHAVEKLPIIFIKQQWSNEELKLVEITIQESLSMRKQLWHDEIKKLSALQGRKAQEERVKKLNHWINNTSVQYYCLSSSESDFEALHWTPLPQPDEAQITFKIAFPRSCLTRSELFELVKRISNAYRWQYQYEWSHGMLLRIEAAKIAIIQHDPETLEISGRIDNAITDDNSDTVPMKSVWPYLSIALTAAIEYFDELSSQYIIRIIPFGNIFYAEKNALPRAFDLTQLLISNDFLKRVAYRDNGILHHLNLVQLFPELKPKTLAEIDEMKAKSNNSTGKEENESRNDPMFLPLPERSYTTGCGRRVSFGSVKCIPQPLQKIEPDVELDDMPNEKSKKTQYEIMVDNYVDLIMDETMRQIKIS
uniref:Bm10143 n=1 Tax=Brugia malayi TaxID=6279 RepID=A0A0J9XW84_BRUMA|nr:Bm10143 [Brugia malayi]